MFQCSTFSQEEIHKCSISTATKSSGYYKFGLSYLSTDATGCALFTGVLVSVGACTYTRYIDMLSKRVLWCILSPFCSVLIASWLPLAYLFSHIFLFIIGLWCIHNHESPLPVLAVSVSTVFCVYVTDPLHHCPQVHSGTCDDSATGHHSTRHLLRPCTVWDRKFNLAVFSCVSLTLYTS